MDQVHDDSVPIDTSVSIVVVPCRALMKAARWKIHPDHHVTGVAMAATTHSQPANCSAPTIDSTIVGTPRATATIKRRRRSSSREDAPSSTSSLPTA